MRRDGLRLWLKAEPDRVDGPLGVADGPRLGRLAGRVDLTDGPVALKDELASFGEIELASPEATICGRGPGALLFLGHL